MRKLNILLILIVLLLYSEKSIGQTNSNTGISIQYRGDKLEFVFDEQTEKKLRFLRESYKKVYSEALRLQIENAKRDSIIFHNSINDIKNDSIIEAQEKQNKLEASKYKESEDENSKLKTRIEVLEDSLQIEKDKKNNWKIFALTLSGIVGGTLLGIIIL